MASKTFTGRFNVVDRKTTMYYQALMHSIYHTLDILGKRRAKIKRELKKEKSDFEKRCNCCKSNMEKAMTDRGISVDNICDGCYMKEKYEQRLDIFTHKITSLSYVIKYFKNSKASAALTLDICKKNSQP